MLAANRLKTGPEVAGRTESTDELFVAIRFYCRRGRWGSPRNSRCLQISTCLSNGMSSLIVRSHLGRIQRGHIRRRSNYPCRQVRNRPPNCNRWEFLIRKIRIFGNLLLHFVLRNRDRYRQAKKGRLGFLRTVASINTNNLATDPRRLQSKLRC